MEGHPWQRRLLSLSRHLLHPLPSSRPTLHTNHTMVSALICPESEMGNPVIVGGMVLDIHARPCTILKPGTTTPGKVEYIQGGVARNVAECMAILGTKPFIISVLGHDMAGNMLLKHWSSLGLTTEGILITQNSTTPVVMNIFDSNGELASAVASVEAVEKYLSNVWIEHFRWRICAAPVLTIDANLHPQLLKVACQIAADYGVPIWFEPVSVIKSGRVASVIKYLTFVSPNERELIAMASALCPENGLYSYDSTDENGKRLSPEAMALKLKPAICLLLDQGVKVVMVTLGSDGVLLCSREDPNFMKKSTDKARSTSQVQLYELVNASCSSDQLINSINSRYVQYPYALHFPALPSSVESLTGAGDCFVGGALTSICSGLDLVQSVAVAVSVAKAAIEIKANVPFQFSLTKIAGWMLQWNRMPGFTFMGAP